MRVHRKPSCLSLLSFEYQDDRRLCECCVGNGTYKFPAVVAGIGELFLKLTPLRLRATPGGMHFDRIRSVFPSIHRLAFLWRTSAFTGGVHLWNVPAHSRCRWRIAWFAALSCLVSLFQEKETEQALGAHDMQQEHRVTLNPV